MASEIRVNTINNRSGLGTITLTDTGAVFSGITTISDLRTSGTSVVAAGTTAAPSISPTGDSNTGIFFPSADTIAFAKGGVEAARIDSSGRVGIGTDTVNFSQFGSNTGGVAIQDIGGTNTGIKLSDGNYHNYLVQAGNSNLYLSHYGSGGDIIFGTGSSGEERSRITSGGNVQIANGNLVFSTAGTGIDFSATANSSGTMTSELLSDYEEGTWTPAISGSSSGTVTTGVTIGTYTRVGRNVTLRFTFVNPSATTIGGTWRLTGLPFAIRQSSSEYVGGFVHYNRTINTAGNWLGLFQETSSAGLTYFRVMAHYMNGTESYDISGNVSSSLLFAGTVFYEAA